MEHLLHYLKNKNLVWQGQKQSFEKECRSSGYPELDEWLQGGMPTQGVISINSDIGIGELRLFLPHLRLRQAQHKRLLVFIAPPLQINGEMLVEQGIDLNDLLIVTPSTEQEGLWAAEQCLKSHCCHAVLSWYQQFEVHQVKRLQLAAKQGDALQLIFRRTPQLDISLPVTMDMSLTAQPKGLRLKVNKRIGRWRHQPLELDMSRNWPALQLPLESSANNNIIPFPHQKVV